MPKLKTNRGARKRFRLTAKGKIKKKNAFTRHILTSKGTKQKRQLRGKSILGKESEGLIKQMLPYGSY